MPNEDDNESQKLVAQLLAGPLSTAGDVWGALLGDRIAGWRMTNAMNSAAKAHEEAAKRGLKLEPSRVPNRFAVTWFTKAAETDEPDIQELFAKLLADAATPGGNAPDHRLVEVVSNFTPIDAQAFFLFYKNDPLPWEIPTVAWPLQRAIIDGGTVETAWAAHIISNVLLANGNAVVETLLRSGVLAATVKVVPHLSSVNRFNQLLRSDQNRTTSHDINQILSNLTKTREFVEASNLGIRLFNIIK